jgi:hypothetical protein
MPDGTQSWTPDLKQVHNIHTVDFEGFVASGNVTKYIPHTALKSTAWGQLDFC